MTERLEPTAPAPHGVPAHDGPGPAGPEDGPRRPDRRRALGLLAAGAGLVALAACGSSGDGEAATSTTAAAGDGAASTSSAGGEATSGTIPDETAGPYPADGTDRLDLLAEDGVVRRDIRRSFGGASGVAEGVPLTIELTLLDVAAGGTPLAGAAVHLWHCDRDGWYSMYSEPVVAENYLRGVQASANDGTLTFVTTFPGAYDDRWPHIHFAVYESVEAATGGGRKLKTSQLALPEDACADVYATDGYERSATNIARSSLDGDFVFSDGYASQLPTTSGSIDDALTMRLNVGV
ncbi:MAG TPA: hypothetical protein VHK88_18475 [Aquihabitans sp.]|jgi:protocatechuate 3,4-dioxygenase beta subunit|nr:hypothetical protein [Aquihabitans sp.]